MENQKKYYLQFTIICVGALLLSYGLSQTTSRYFNTSHFWIPTLFFAVTTLGTNALLTKGDKQSKEFVFKTLVFVYSLINKPEALAFTCHFMIQYVLFTVFEMSFLLKYIKQTD
jgi:cytochrome b561